MRISQFTIATIRVPLKRPFRHATASREDSMNILVRCQLENGTVGWGEGVPRSYVTGDTPESSLALMAQLPLKQLFDKSPADWLGVIEMLQRLFELPIGNDPRGALGNPLKAALELSVLDAYGRLFGRPIADIVPLIPEASPLVSPRKSVRYSTTIDSQRADRLWFSSLKMRVYGFKHCKVKVGTEGESDVTRLQTIRSWLGKSFDIRLDANGVWNAAESIAKVRELKPFGISVIEQPSPHEALPQLASAKEQHGVRVMLDESLTSWHDANEAIRYEACDLFNLRLSKCGGFIPCLKLAALAKHHGLGYQLGCHPGETAILSAAGRQWAQMVGGIEYLEGSYDHHILRENVINSDITFGYGGVAKALTGSGLGVEVDAAKVEPLVITRQVHALRAPA